MSDTHIDILKKALKGMAIALPLVAASSAAKAEDLTAGVVLKEMSGDQISSYLAGIVEGFAYARYQRDAKATEGMQCMYDWFYRKEGTVTAILAAFAEYGDYTPGAVIAGMLQKECGA